MSTPLRVVGPAWMAGDIGATADWGFDVPDEPSDFWCSGDHYARLRASGFDISLTTPGGVIPLVGLTQREVAVCELVELAARPPASAAFVKPNDVKLPGIFEAKVYDPGELRAAIDTLLGARSVSSATTLTMSVSEPVDFGVEVRSFVLDGEVIECCAYSNGQGAWGRGLDDLVDDVSKYEIKSMIATLANSATLPRAFVVDIGFVDGGWDFIETNPAASSSWYSWTPGSDVAEAIRVGQHDDPVFEWTDPLKHRPLTPLTWR